MASEVLPNEPSAESLLELPEVDFSRAVRPNRLAGLRGDYQHAVFLEPELWDHFGSVEKVVEALRLLVEIARRKDASTVTAEGQAGRSR